MTFAIVCFLLAIVSVSSLAVGIQIGAQIQHDAYVDGIAKHLEQEG